MTQCVARGAATEPVKAPTNHDLGAARGGECRATCGRDDGPQVVREAVEGGQGKAAS